MSLLTINLDGGMTDAGQSLAPLGALFTQSGLLRPNSFLVSALDSPGMFVEVPGSDDDDCLIIKTDDGSTYFVKNTLDLQVPILANSSGVTKTDAIVLFVDLSAGDADNAGSPGAAQVISVRRDGVSTGAPTDGEIDSATSNNPWFKLKEVTVTHGTGEIEGEDLTYSPPQASYIARTFADENGNAQLTFVTMPDAVNAMTHLNAAAGNAPTLGVTGSDTNIDFNLVPKGTGKVTKAGRPIDGREEIGRTVLSVAGDTITVNSLPTRKYLTIKALLLDTGGTINASLRFNNDSGTTYARRLSTNMSADNTSTGTTALASASQTANPVFIIWEVANVAAIEKLAFSTSSERGSAGAGNLPTRNQMEGKWANTSTAITRIDVANSGTGDFAIGSEVIVYGHD